MSSPLQFPAVNLSCWTFRHYDNEFGSKSLGPTMSLRADQMVTSSLIQSDVKEQPFRPFRLNMASGKTFEIRHPEMIKVSKTFLVVFSPAAD